MPIEIKIEPRPLTHFILSTIGLIFMFIMFALIIMTIYLLYVLIQHLIGPYPFDNYTVVAFIIGGIIAIIFSYFIMKLVAESLDINIGKSGITELVNEYNKIEKENKNLIEKINKLDEENFNLKNKVHDIKNQIK